MLAEEDPDQTSPHERLDAKLDAADGVADRERDAERQRDPERVEPVDRPHHRVVVQVPSVLSTLFHAQVREHPADVRVHKAGERAPGALRVAGVRRVRATLLVRERVVLAVIGHPLRRRPLHRHAAEDRERCLDGRARLETPVREVAVEADRRPERGHRVGDGEHRHVEPVERDTPEHAHRGDDAERRHDHNDQHGELPDPVRSGPDGAHTLPLLLRDLHPARQSTVPDNRSSTSVEAPQKSARNRINVAFTGAPTGAPCASAGVLYHLSYRPRRREPLQLLLDRVAELVDEHVHMA